jgi:hypothetical protein
MKKCALLLILLSVTILYGQEIKSYNLSVKIDAAGKKVDVSGFLNINFKGKDSISLVLWKDSKIKSITSKNVSVKFVFDTSSVTPIMYIPNGRKLTLVKSSHSTDDQSVFVKYTSDMKGLNGWAKSFTDEWIELNFYSAWFPVGLNERNSTSKLKLKINDGYLVTGSGKVHRKFDGWEIEQDWNSFDNVIISAKNLKSKKLHENGSFIEIVYGDFSNQDADSTIRECKNALDLYNNYFGRKDSAYIKFVIAPFEQGGGYSRKNFVRMGTKHFNSYTTRGVGHEIAHFWWNNANTTTWQDWLNEAFAEYSMLMFIRERSGVAKFLKLIEEYKSRTKNLPPIWGINRNAPESYSVLYEKGSLILYELETLIGKEKFKDLLKDISKNKIADTDPLLNLIGKKLSAETEQWLETKLKTY